MMNKDNQDIQYNQIKQNIAEVRERIANAAKKSGRKAEDITLIAVTKTVEPERIVNAIDEGICDLGENRVQELLEKYDIIERGCNWHLIGHLQTNKVKYIAGKVALIHSVDSLHLAREISLNAKKLGTVVDILVQVNVSGEESKYGISPDAVTEFLSSVAPFENIRVRGLMTMAPHSESPETVRYVFAHLRKIFIDIKKENIDNIHMDFLSMGMSNDYEIAIEEGSNMVRVGTAIFGKRNF